jgi:hypothetical protein
MSCVVYTREEYNRVFGQLKECFGKSVSINAKEILYKTKCKEDNLKELFLYIWALNDWTMINNTIPSEDNFLTIEEFDNIVTRVLSICNCNV